MKISKRKLILTSLLASLTHLQGAETTNANIWISGMKEKAKLEVVQVEPTMRGNNSPFMKDNSAHGLTFQTKNGLNTEWEEYKFTFKSDKDTVLQIFLSGVGKGKTNTPIDVDGLSVKNGQIKNGDFEDTKKNNGSLKRWYSKQSIDLKSDGTAKSGEKHVSIRPKTSIGNAISVKADQAVEVSLFARASSS